MKVLQHDELIDYLNKAIDVETDVAIQEKIIEEYEKEVEKTKPELALKSIPKPMPEAPTLNGQIGSIMFGMCMIATGLITLCACAAFGIGEYISFLIGIAIFSLLSGIWYAIPPLMKYKNETASYKSTWNYYKQQIESLNKENEEIKQHHDIAVYSWKQCYNENKNALVLPLQQTKEVLDRLYSEDVIYPKYRNLPALTSICEYFITGRCTELTGPHGAYNLYEDEVRKDMVISQLSMVIENLEIIKNNQYMLYQQVKRIRENTDAMTQELRMIRGYTFNIMQTSAMTAYYSQITAKYTRRDYWFNN